MPKKINPRVMVLHTGILWSIQVRFVGGLSVLFKFVTFSSNFGL